MQYYSQLGQDRFVDEYLNFSDYDGESEFTYIYIYIWLMRAEYLMKLEEMVGILIR